MLSPVGMLIFNLIEPSKVCSRPRLAMRSFGSISPTVRVFSIEGYENRVVVFSPNPLDSSLLREGLCGLGVPIPVVTELGDITEAVPSNRL